MNNNLHPLFQGIFQSVTDAQEASIEAQRSVIAQREQKKSIVIPRSLSVFVGGTRGNPDKCFYCGKVCRTTRDHFFPKSLGGRLTVRCCRECNGEKANMTPPEWIEYLKDQLHSCSMEKGCNRGTFIRSHCPDECSGRRKLERMIRASESLWQMVEWSVKNFSVSELR